MIDLVKYNRRRQIMLITFAVIGGLFLSYVGLLTKVYFLTSVFVPNPLQLNSVFHAYQPIILPHQQNIHCCMTALIPYGGESTKCPIARRSEKDNPWLKAFRPKRACSKLCPEHNLYRSAPRESCP